MSGGNTRSRMPTTAGSSRNSPARITAAPIAIDDSAPCAVETFCDSSARARAIS
jgi:hypothetical protein